MQQLCSSGFPIRAQLAGDILSKIDKNKMKITKITCPPCPPFLLGGKRKGGHGGQVNLLSSGANPSGGNTTRGNPAYSYGRNQETM